ncbi:AfsR/SARP family transcriptional regulator [Streptomyces cellulosae]|jgi:DNA-binding SARP family transcriptional activator|uniref:AfsR/SARP family transcriptional regulator n=2 Tax=Streptomyces TaxID=1883 RepID=A0ABU3JC17_9ACTN|nr:AfsR/SARP family transcriptional regulator [Streptomyces sp. McG7]MBT2904657.1 AfsR/SARP family transcriptional regulator [Streptomyces sp. McG8]MCX4475747.1 AfsR/SARP family transcriptional regulator [Streptomyces cellulosae]MDQ0489493.1 DNA-binding SARP family transcriptional activator [Streptomyces thermodiastaticus]MDT6972603.1 AfsR/SARP family transcriptional regulator [Streptomyces thermocarboxydus]MDX3417619.1 AfsR/SARP family transcriptional regulator [Streptomyces sp. MD20-1-1]MXQ
MDIAVLGPLAVRQADVSIVPSAGKPRQVLALLALRAGSVVPVPTLMDEVWGDAIPRSANTTLQTYILQVRRRISEALGPSAEVSAKDLLTTCFGGYQLTAQAVRSDLAEFNALVTRGDALLAEGNARAASATLERALSLWRGPALVDVPLGRVLATEVLGMDEARIRAKEMRIEADLRLGRHAALLGELRMLVSEHPLHEKLRAQLMLALYRSGHAWRALEAYQQLRRTLVEELGVDPSPRLQRLHQAVLAGDPRLEAPSTGESLTLAG